MMTSTDAYFEFPPVSLSVDCPCPAGRILDIGGGGEGVIGRLHRARVVAADLRLDELTETPSGPHKAVLDARRLPFAAGSFAAATAFFSLMYLAEARDQLAILLEAARVLPPGAELHIWEVDLAHLPQTEQRVFVIPLHLRMADAEISTSYGALLPTLPRGEAHYQRLAACAGFRPLRSERQGNTFHLVFTRVKFGL
jgi:hypothetical protein